MPCQLLVHLTWTTRERRPLIDASCADFLERFIPSASSLRGAKVVAIGVVSTHVHVILWLPPTVDIPRLVQTLKGASSRIASRDGIVKGGKLWWASGYDLRSISPRSLPKAVEYVEGQARHHPREAIQRDSAEILGVPS